MKIAAIGELGLRGFKLHNVLLQCYSCQAQLKQFLYLNYIMYYYNPEGVKEKKTDFLI